MKPIFANVTFSRRVCILSTVAGHVSSRRLKLPRSNPPRNTAVLCRSRMPRVNGQDV